jgi:hypothetical protein
MGTALDETTDPEQQGKIINYPSSFNQLLYLRSIGIVPRFIYDLFKRLEAKKESSLVHEYKVYVSFLELYNEDFVDLLNASAQQQQQSNRKRSNSVSHVHAVSAPCEVQIREDVHGQIYWSGVREEQCSCPDELLRYLTKGSLCRTTGSTDMNSVSSRSHAIFSVILKQQVNDAEDQAATEKPNENLRTIVSKFHFVDLAGSERVSAIKPHNAIYSPIK